MTGQGAFAREPVAFQDGIAEPGDPVASRADDPFALTVLQVGLCASVLVRFLLPGNLLNLVVDYTSDGGALPAKIHPGTYGVLVLCVLAAARLRPVLVPWEWRLARQLVVLVGVVVALAALTIVAGHAVSAGYLVDTYISACLTGLLMLALPAGRRHAVGATLLAFMLANALIALGERATSLRLVPYPYGEVSFRPTAISDHPLALGLFLAGSVVSVTVLRLPVWLRVAATALLVLAAFASGARTAALVAAAAAAICLVAAEIPLATRLRRLQARLVLVLGLCVAGPAAYVALSLLGFLDRFQKVGLMDESADARVRIYDLFGMVGWPEILFGADPLMIRRLAHDRLGLAFIESPVITFVFQFGAIGAVILFLTILWTFRRLCAGTGWRGWLSAGAFLVCALSNNTLATKNPLLLMMVVYLIAWRRPAENAARAAVA